ncbi:hypothetical protein [Arthrobacter bambusae]|uniref:Uncharacterized protein n=1 Tax=Arthrobacter bambusae TaxID=1338426 RepID=A0AAW8D623_9MICC|nr:hypothetical protein [Arthrobacter bambusae]MDP9903155.1 hypothetical protein [Arthrobacter bambusae]MDQ0128851.1 hypothetical protein [Arthrobacter bambusae]MDQ0180192.1 hypothetical protein [Arthrobacter bambusae]
MNTEQTPSLRSRIHAVIRGSAHKAIVFHDLDAVPLSSSGYFSPSGRNATLTSHGWMAGDRTITPAKGEIFTSHQGPANDDKLAELITAELTPEHHVLVDFEAVTGREPGDWESGLPGYDFTTLANPDILGHNLNESELAHLYFEIEDVGSLGESDAYSDLDKAIKKLGEEPAERLSKLADTSHSGLFELNHDQKDPA